MASSAEVKEAVAEYFNSPSSFDMFTGVKTAPVTIFDSPSAGKSGGGASGNTSGEGSGASGNTSGEGSGAAGNTSGEGASGENQGGFMSFYNDEGTKTGGNTEVVSEKMYEMIQDSIAARELLEKTGNELKSDVEELMAEATSVDMQNILSSVKIEITSEGIRIDLIESNDNNFFEIGSARLKPDAVTVLKQLANRIGRLSNYVEIEGHTDSRKYSNYSTYGNWELSSDRANSARKILEANGFYPGQITSVSGHADRKLKRPDSPFDVSNRRVSILVRNLSRQDFVGT